MQRNGKNIGIMKKLLYFVAGLVAVLAFASCENAISGKLEGKWRVITVSGYEIYDSEKSETHIIDVKDKFNYWEFLEDGTFELYYIKESGEKKIECAGTWTRNGAKVDLKIKDAEESDNLQIDGTIMQLTASELVFQMTQTSGNYSIIEVYTCNRE